MTLLVKTERILLHSRNKKIQKICLKRPTQNSRPHVIGISCPKLFTYNILFQPLIITSTQISKLTAYFVLPLPIRHHCDTKFKSVTSPNLPI